MNLLIAPSSTLPSSGSSIDSTVQSLRKLKTTLLIWKQPEAVEECQSFLLEALAECPAVAVDDVLAHLRASYKGAFWPKPWDIRRSVEAIMARRAADGTDKPPERHWEHKPETHTGPKTASEREHVRKCAEQMRKLRNVPIAEALAYYRKLLNTGWEGTMADAAALYFDNPPEAGGGYDVS